MKLQETILRLAYDAGHRDGRKAGTGVGVFDIDAWLNELRGILTDEEITLLMNSLDPELRELLRDSRASG